MFLSLSVLLCIHLPATHKYAGCYTKQKELVYIPKSRILTANPRIVNVLCEEESNCKKQEMAICQIRTDDELYNVKGHCPIILK